MSERWRPEFDSFRRYLEDTKGADQLRFWQSLFAWALVAYEDLPVPSIKIGEQDTFHWEAKGRHPIGP